MSPMVLLNVQMFLPLLLRFYNSRGLLTPPGSPLIPSLDGKESQPTSIAPRRNPFVRSGSTILDNKVCLFPCLLRCISFAFHCHLLRLVSLFGSRVLIAKGSSYTPFQFLDVTIFLDFISS